MKNLLIALSVCCSMAMADPTLDSVTNSDNAKPATQQPKVIMVKGSTTTTTNSNTSKKTHTKTSKTHHSPQKHKSKSKTNKKQRPKNKTKKHTPKKTNN